MLTQYFDVVKRARIVEGEELWKSIRKRTLSPQRQQQQYPPEEGKRQRYQGESSQTGDDQGSQGQQERAVGSPPRPQNQQAQRRSCARRCFGCGETGHLRRLCPRETRTVSTAAVQQMTQGHVYAMSEDETQASDY
ncbi:zinc finger protein [Macleaya cordata]|uniref:Zinc finger protein n=1 Tax=Macleaya cordata TaxID=56857 RepID=A0A200QAL4_MACCD|nr:zinc finger protein [Macleaya cordata]